MSYSEYFGGRFAVLSAPSLAGLGIGAATGWFLALGIGVGLMTIPVVHSIRFTAKVPEFAYAVVSREDLILPETWGSGIHNCLPGDEVFVIKTNPIPIDIVVKRQLTDGREATVTLQITVTPHARIANEDKKNAYGAWVIEDDEEHAKAHVKDAIIKPMKGILTNVIGRCSSVDLDKWNLGLALLVESEVALHKAPHHLAGDPKHRFPARPEGMEILEWYNKHHERIREYLDHCDEQFEEALANEELTRASHYLSHHEMHVGCVFNSAEIVTIVYDEATSDAKKRKYVATQNADAVKPTMDAIDSATAGLIAKGVSPNAAAMLAASAAKVDGIRMDGRVYSGAGSDIIKADILGGAVGDGMKGGK